MSETDILEDQRVLLTGGAGFVGSNIARVLLERGAQITILDDLSTGREAVVPKDARVTFVRGDVRDVALLEEIVPKHQFVVHAAAKNILMSTRNPIDDYETNIGGTLKLLLAARKWGVRRFVYTGSASIYGNPVQLPIIEDTPGYPLSPYAVSKLAGENYCIAFWEAYGFPAVVVRYSNVYGVNQDPTNSYCGVVSKFFDWAMHDQPLQIHGDGDQTRDFTYVEDAATATVEALINPRAVSQVFNIGTGREVSINELARKICEITRAGTQIEYVEKRDIDNIRRRVMNIERIRRSLRWLPRHTLETGLRATYEWLRSEDRGGSR